LPLPQPRSSGGAGLTPAAPEKVVAVVVALGSVLVVAVAVVVTAVVVTAMVMTETSTYCPSLAAVAVMSAPPATGGMNA
jgi:hypothetical protein